MLLVRRYSITEQAHGLEETFFYLWRRWAIEGAQPVNLRPLLSAVALKKLTLWVLQNFFFS
jgi:hypothetical protein